MCEWGPLKNQKPSLQKCIFQHEDLTKLTVVQIYDTIHFFSGKFVNLLRLEGKSHHFCLKGFIKIFDYTCKVQLFWTIKLFVLILTQLFKNKIIRCFGVQQTHPTRIPHNKDRIKKQLVAYCLVLLAHLQCLCLLNIELEHSMFHLIFQKA